MQEAEFRIETILANVKSERSCKQCGVNVGKGLQLCTNCRESSRKARERKKLKGVERLPSFLNFRRDDHGSPVEKRCTDCDQWFPVAKFSTRKDTASGCRPFCKQCEAARSKKYYPAPKPPQDRICTRCGGSFVGKGKNIYCSGYCAASSKMDRQRGAQRIAKNSIQVATEAKCRRCGELKPLSGFATKKQHQPFKCLPSACAECKEKTRKKNEKIAKARSMRDPKNKPRKRLSKRFHETMAIVKNGGTHHLREFIGCSTSALRRRLELRFTRGMSWKNYGTKWHVDHILPVSSFDHGDINQVQRCWHYSNLRPLCAIANNIKSNRIITCQPELLLQLVDN